MKIFTFIFTVLLFTACEKEPCDGTIKVVNNGTVSATIISFDSSPIVKPGESKKQVVKFCKGHDENGNPCTNSIQMPVTYKFEGDQDLRQKGIIVTSCETAVVEIVN